MECHHYGRAPHMGKFYACPMSLRIKQLREEKGWTQEQLAARARMSRSHLAMVEKETRPANTLKLNAIASALGVRPEELFEADDEATRLIELLRLLHPADRAVVEQMIQALAPKPPQG
jgi:transcriptional regulator with XRE-family HTH domain